MCHKKLNILTQAKREYQSIVLKELSEKSGISQEKIEILSNLEDLLSSISLDELIESINNEEINDNSLLYDDTFEERLIDKYSTQEVISIIISTLPKVNQNILILYYRLNGSISYTMEEIAKMYGITKVGTRSIIVKTLNMIRNSLRVKCLKEIYEVPDTFEEEQDDILNLELEEFLIRKLPNNIITEVSKELSEIHTKFLYLYHHEKNYKMIEIAKILNVSKSHAYKIKRQTIEVIRSNIMQSITTITNNKCITYDEYYKYIEYLMHIYSHKTKIKKRS